MANAPAAAHATVVPPLSAEHGVETSALDGRWQWLYLVVTAFTVVGLFIDGWSHSHVNRSGEGILTVWHAPMYLGYVASALILFRLVERHRVPGAGWRRAAPAGYGWAVLVTFLLPIGGTLDLVWHRLFGLEQSLEALISPTHLVMITALAVLIGAPFRAWVAEPEDAAKRDRFGAWRAVISMGFILAAVEFVTGYSQPLVHLFASSESQLPESSAIPGFLFQSGIFACGMAALLQARNQLPVGALTVLFVVPLAGVGLLNGGLGVAAASAVVAGIAGDAALVLLRRSRRAGLIVIVPPVAIFGLWSSYFAVLAVRHNISWVVHVWTGTIVMSAVVAAVIARLALARRAVSAVDGTQAG